VGVTIKRPSLMITYIPIRGPEISELDDEYERFLNDFRLFTETNDIKKLVDNETAYQTIEFLKFTIIKSSKATDREDKEIKIITDKYPFLKTDYIEEVLKIELSYEEGHREDDNFASISLNFMLSKLALIVNLTYATKIDFLPGIIFSENNKYLGKTEIILSSLDYAYEHSLKIGWPQVTHLKLQDTVTWYNINNLHPDSNSKNKLHRAINSFSYQFSRLLEKDTSILFWTMLGIEALLAEGSNNIIGQIKVKSSIILGEPVEYKRKLDKLYNYRSRFVHGDINFPAKFSSDYENFEQEYWEYLHFSTSILIALIRNLIVNNKNAFQFEYKLVP
jgi:hypothetical protein